MSYDGWRPVRFDDFVPGMKKNNWSILIWTCVYLLNLVLVFVFQGISYDLPYEEVNNLISDVRNNRNNGESELFPGCQLLDVYSSDMFLMRDKSGNLEIAILKQNSVQRSYKVDERIPVPEGKDVAVNVETEWNVYTLRILDGERIDEESTLVEQNRNLGALFWRSYFSSNGLTIYLLIAVVMLLVEYGFYSQIQKLRE